MHMVSLEGQISSETKHPFLSKLEGGLKRHPIMPRMHRTNVQHTRTEWQISQCRSSMCWGRDTLATSPWGSRDCANVHFSLLPAQVDRTTEILAFAPLPATVWEFVLLSCHENNIRYKVRGTVIPIEQYFCWLNWNQLFICHGIKAADRPSKCEATGIFSSSLPVMENEREWRDRR